VPGKDPPRSTVRHAPSKCPPPRDDRDGSRRADDRNKRPSLPLPSPTTHPKLPHKRHHPGVAKHPADTKAACTAPRQCARAAVCSTTVALVPCVPATPGQAALKRTPGGAAGRLADSRRPSAHAHQCGLWRRCRNVGGRVGSTDAAARAPRPLAARPRAAAPPRGSTGCPHTTATTAPANSRGPRADPPLPASRRDRPRGHPTLLPRVYCQGTQVALREVPLPPALGGGCVPLSPCGTRRPSRSAAPSAEINLSRNDDRTKGCYATVPSAAEGGARGGGFRRRSNG